MIHFTEDYEEVYKREERKYGKNRLLLLEKFLRKLGNFEKKKDIFVPDGEFVETGDWLFEVIDLEGTSFKFYNFDFGISKKGANRYSKNFYLLMKKPNSHFTYVYDFYNTKPNQNRLKVIKLQYNLSKNRQLEVLSRGDQFDTILIEEKDKTYVVEFQSQASLLDTLERKIEGWRKIDSLNLEEILLEAETKEDLVRASIYLDNHRIASIHFRRGEITDYEIKEPNRLIFTKIKEEVKREVERTLPDTGKTVKMEEVLDANSEKVQTDLKRLFKQL